MRISTAVVTGPTPPGTGVTSEATGSTAAVSTSPTMLPSGASFVPTSITTAPGRTWPAPIRCARPAAATRTPARRRLLLELARARVADGDRGVLGEEEHRERLADDDGAADDDRVGALERGPGVVEELDHGLGGRRREGRQAGREPSEARRARAVHVLRGRDPLAGLGEA